MKKQEKIIFEYQLNKNKGLNELKKEIDINKLKKQIIINISKKVTKERINDLIEKAGIKIKTTEDNITFLVRKSIKNESHYFNKQLGIYKLNNEIDNLHNKIESANNKLNLFISEFKKLKNIKLK